MSAPGRLILHTPRDRLIIHLPAYLTPLLELGWLVIAALLVAALLPAAMTGSALMGGLGVVVVAVITGLLLRGAARRYAATLVLTDECVIVQYNRTRRVARWSEIDALHHQQLGPLYIPTLEGLSSEEREWLSTVLEAFSTREKQQGTNIPDILERLQVARQ